MARSARAMTLADLSWGSIEVTPTDAPTESLAPAHASPAAINSSSAIFAWASARATVRRPTSPGAALGFDRCERLRSIERQDRSKSGAGAASFSGPPGRNPGPQSALGEGRMATELFADSAKGR